MSEQPAEQFWGELRRRAQQAGVSEVLVRFRKDVANTYPAKLLLGEEQNELRLSPQAVAGWSHINPAAIAAQVDGWRSNFNRYKGAERLSGWQACVYLYGPLFNPTWTKHAYNPLVDLLVAGEDARRLDSTLDQDEAWVSLSELKELIAGPAADDGVADAEAPRAVEFPRFEDVAAQLGSGGAIETHALHNVDLWASVHGSLQLLHQYPHAFDPREDYWWLVERRLLVVFFAERFALRYLPSDALRRVVHAVFAHFDRARRDGRLGPKLGVTEQAARWDELLDACSLVADELPAIPEYDQLRKTWRHLKATTVNEELAAFLQTARDFEGPAELDAIGFVRRIPWFPYLGLEALSQLAARQMFFAAYHRLFTSSNAYVHGGSMGFAPVIQNNPTETLLGYVRRWTSGETLDQTKFYVEGRDDRAERGHYNVVVELYGFLNLHRQPFYNNKSVAYAAFAEDGDESVLPSLVRIGARVREFVSQHGLAARWAAEFRRMVANAQLGDGVAFEGIRVGKKAKANLDELDAQIDARFARELRGAAVERAQALSDLDAAATLFHLLLDAAIYSGGELAQPHATPAVAAPAVIVRRDERSVRLPASLEPVANDALAILKAGFHVLLAGAPGTGKTTAAQFVGHAWNHALDRVQTSLPLSAAPLTTVGNSAWAPFHTIGGILPDKDGQFATKAGIFVDPKSVGSASWRLRDEAIVLDEMNRADLDRCIGELYPLLSMSVDRVTPAGIPGVDSISSCDKFRIIATVNDSNLDDIVFPISEGLARRFIRIELGGARMSEIQEFLAAAEVAPDKQRLDVAARSLAAFFQHCRDHGLLTSSDLGEHLPFGVGYFGLFRSWCGGRLAMSAEFSELGAPEQAARIVRMCLRAATKDARWEKVFRAFETQDEEA